MQAIIETLFDSIYLTGVMILGLLMIKKSNGNKQYLLFGIMAIVLGLGDSFHLVPRALALCTTGLQDYTFALGIGKFITSITMTIFYIILYYVWRLRYQIQGKNNITIAVYVLAIIRIALCLFPQNAWTSAASSLSWGIYRNIPFTIMGFIIIYLFYNSAKENHDGLSIYVANDCHQLWFLSSRRFIRRYRTDDWHVDDSKDLCLYMDSIYWLSCYEKRTPLAKSI